ncbi:MAG TPA: LacI family DNA-binding transcriptional regulator [Solirubrobacterales bacterium]|nr:LacI family DNA-binding transcriptional regulator [Solirubrobacterales bacterium]
MKALSRTDGNSRPPTLSDVARKAKVSLSTASRTLNGNSDLVRGDLRERVHAAARELGYVPNAHAQSLARATTSTIGLIVHDIADPYFSAIARGAEQVATEQGLLVMIGSDFADPERELEYLESLAAQRVRGIILCGSGFESKTIRARALAQLEAYARFGGRVAAISEHRMPVDTVRLDNRGGARELTRYLIEQGHRELAVVTGPSGLTTWRDRLAGVRAAAEAAGIEVESACVHEIAPNRDAAYEATSAILAGGHRPTAVIALTDVMALGVLAALRDRGVEVPAEISVVGFDDIDLARDVTPPLTTVGVPMEELGRRAVEMVVAPAASKPRRVQVETELVVRESVAPRALTRLGP